MNRKIAGGKCAVVVSEDLPTGPAVNAASVLAVTLGHQVDGLVGVDVEDADGVVHPGIIGIPLPVLRASAVVLADIAGAAAADPDLFRVGFSSLAQRCRTYDEYVEQMAATPAAALDVVGIGLYGPRRRVDRLVGSLPLMR